MYRALLRYWRQPAHYYWLTSFLAARDAQQATCRMIAGLVAVLALVPLAMQWSPAGPHTDTARWIAAAATVCGAALALIWLRRRWPSHGQSAAFAVVSALCIAAGALVMSNALAGLLFAAGFAVLGGYVALFHTAGQLLLVLTVAEATALTLALRVADAGDPVSAVMVMLTVTAVNIGVPAACHLILRALDTDTDTDIDTLTGLLNRASFYRAAGNMVSRCRDDDKRLVLVLIDLDNMRLLRATDGEIACERARVAVAQTLRETTRHNAFVGRLGHDEYLIADTFSTPDSFPLVERVRNAVASTPPRVTASIGVVSTLMRGLGSCPPDELLDELIGIATVAMNDARAAGGNQARYVTCDKPAVLDGLRRCSEGEPQ